MTGEASTSDRLGRSPRTSQASKEMISTSRLPITVPSPAPIAAIVWLHRMRSAARNTPARRASQRLRDGIGVVPVPPRLRSRRARTPSTGRAKAHRPSATTLGEAVLASFISTAELEMQTAPAVAAATGGMVVTRTERVLLADVINQDSAMTLADALLPDPGGRPRGLPGRPRRLIPVRDAVPEVAVQDRLHHLGEGATLIGRGPVR